jgi:hypothetical protein
MLANGRRARWLVALLALGVAAACGGEDAGSTPDGGNEPAGDSVSGAAPVRADSADGSLVRSFDVDVRADSVRFSLRVSNAATTPLVLDYTSGQRFDFMVLDGSGESVWTWSATRSFMQALQADTLAPGETVSYDAVWRPEGRSGMFAARATLVAVNASMELETEFELENR